MLAFVSSKCEHFWTTLTTQYRMAPQIREFVSDLTYHGKLTDGPSVSERSSEIVDKISNSFPEVKSSRVVFYNIDSAESKVNCQFFVDLHISNLMMITN